MEKTEKVVEISEDVKFVIVDEETSIAQGKSKVVPIRGVMVCRNKGFSDGYFLTVRHAGSSRESYLISLSLTDWALLVSVLFRAVAADLTAELKAGLDGATRAVYAMFKL